MSFASSAALGEYAPINLGERSYHDPVLAMASLDASKIAQLMARSTPSRRRSVMLTEMEKLGRGLGQKTDAEARRLISRGFAPDRAAFDAMRTTLANRRVSDSMARIQAAATEQRMIEADGLGQINLSDSDRQVGCLVAGATTTVGGVVQAIPVYGQIIGGLLQAGSTVAGSAMDCGKAEREAQQRLAASQAREAQQRILAAQAEAVAAASRRKRLFIVGGLTLGIVAVGAIALS